MIEYQERVIEEQLELQKKVDLLRIFLEKGKPEHIDDDEWYRLDKQYGAMWDYNDALKDRIFWFNTPSEK